MKPYRIAYIYKPCGAQRPAERSGVERVLNKLVYGNVPNLPGGGGLLRILGGGVHPGSPNPDPTSDRKISLFTLVFRHGL